MVLQPCALLSLEDVASFLLPPKLDDLLAHEWFDPMLQEAVQVIAGGPPWLLTAPAPPVDPQEVGSPQCPLSAWAMGEANVTTQVRGCSLPDFIQGVTKEPAVAILKTPIKKAKGSKLVEAPTARHSGRLTTKAAL
jgi:hypothetical protein